MTMAARMRGFTLIEAMVALTILSLTLAVGIPRVTGWLTAARAGSTAEFYAEGLRLARSEAVKRNVVSRLTLIDNPSNGQQDWRVDICAPTPLMTCREPTSSWSTVTTAAAGSGVADFRSVLRSATSLPPSTLMTVTRSPAGADDVYFTPTGWVDGTMAPSLNRIGITPAPGNADAFPAAAVTVTLAGVVSKCNPALAAQDSRGCPP